MKSLSDSLPIPDRLRAMPIHNGYVVPWFVAKVGGSYDFRVVDGTKFKVALNKKLCWICGQRLGAYLHFAIGPMCAINRTISEPPSHKDCAAYAVKVCPFLAQRQDDRRLDDLPAGYREAAGISIRRQPGAVAIWVTKSFQVVSVSRGMVFALGDPIEVHWFKDGRAATRAEVLESIDSGYPLLQALAAQEGDFALEELKSMRETAIALIPKE